MYYLYKIIERNNFIILKLLTYFEKKIHIFKKKTHWEKRALARASLILQPPENSLVENYGSQLKTQYIVSQTYMHCNYTYDSQVKPYCSK